MAGVIGSAATTATTTATMAARAAQCVNGYFASHMNEISAATNAAAIGANTETLVHWGKRNILAGLSILKPIFGNGNTMSELWVRNMNYVAFAEAARLLEIAYKAKINKELNANFVVKSGDSIRRTWDPIRVHEIKMTIPYHSTNKRLISSEPVSIPYKYHLEDGSVTERYLWFYPFVNGGELYKIEVWTDRKWALDFFRGYSTETLEHAKNYILYMLIPTNISKISVVKTSDLDFIFTRAIRFVKKIAEQHDVRSGAMVTWTHHTKTMIEIAPNCMVELWRDPKETGRAVFAIPIGNGGCVSGYEFYFCGGVCPQRFIDRLFSVDHLEEFYENTEHEASHVPIDVDSLAQIFEENNREFIRERDELFSRVKMSFDNSWRNKVSIRKRANLSKLSC